MFSCCGGTNDNFHMCPALYKMAGRVCCQPRRLCITFGWHMEVNVYFITCTSFVWLVVEVVAKVNGGPQM